MVTYSISGRCKQYIRNKIIHLIDNINPKYLFTLPNLHFGIEIYAIKKKIKVVCCEIDKNIYLQQKSKNIKVELYHDNASKILSKYNFDIAWLDFCGPISKELLLSLENLSLTDTGILIVTIALAREHPKYHLPKNKLKFYSNLFAQFGYFSYEIFTYKDHIMPMAVFFCKKHPENIQIYKLE